MLRNPTSLNDYAFELRGSQHGRKENVNMKRTGEVSLKIVRSVTNYTVSIPVPYITVRPEAIIRSPQKLKTI